MVSPVPMLPRKRLSPPSLLPAGDNWNESNWDSWIQAVYRNRAFGYSIDHIVDFSVTADVKNSTWRILDLDQPSLGLPRKYLIKGKRAEH